MTVFAREERDMVAGERDGAGANEVVWVREVADLERSKNSMMDCDNGVRVLITNAML